MWLLLSSLALGSDVAWYADADGDGYGDGGSFIIAGSTDSPVGYVRNDTDCNDNDDEISPDSEESCNGYDDDCDGIIDGEAACDQCSYGMFEDHQYAVCGRGTFSEPFRSWTSARDFCRSLPYDLVSISSAEENTYVLQRIRAVSTVLEFWIGLNDRDDEDQFEWSDGTSFSGNSFAYWNSGEPNNAGNEDCVGINSNASGGWNDRRCTSWQTAAPFVCEAVGDPRLWWPDTDGDGFGDAAGRVIEAHAQPASYSSNSADCDDTNGNIKPGAVELCNGLDDNCNGIVDLDSALLLTVYEDPDGDGFGSGTPFQTCVDRDGLSAVGTDCLEGDPNTYPGAPELCNGVDNDCDGVAENGALDQAEWYTDDDADGYGSGDVRFACSQPDGAVAADGDCDDQNPSRNPGADEVCDGVDNDCDELVDNDPVDPTTWYADLDSDGYGTDDSATQDCVQPDGSSAVGGDCDDENASTYPGAPELEDGLDNDCDGFPEDVDPDTDTSDPDTDTSDDDTSDPDTSGNIVSSRQFDPTDLDATVPSGCSCSVGSQTAPWWAAVGLFGLLALVRRRSHHRN